MSLPRGCFSCLGLYPPDCLVSPEHPVTLAGGNRHQDQTVSRAGSAAGGRGMDHGRGVRHRLPHPDAGHGGTVPAHGRYFAALLPWHLSKEDRIHPKLYIGSKMPWFVCSEGAKSVHCLSQSPLAGTLKTCLVLPQRRQAAHLGDHGGSRFLPAAVFQPSECGGVRSRPVYLSWWDPGMPDTPNFPWPCL